MNVTFVALKSRPGGTSVMVQAGVWAVRLWDPIRMRRLVLTVTSRIIFSRSTKSPNVSAVGTKMTILRRQKIASELVFQIFIITNFKF